MEIAVLTARLEAQTSAFMAGMKAAEMQTEKMQESLKSLERESYAARRAMKEVKMDVAQSEAVKSQAAVMERALDSIYRAALKADDEIHGIDFSAGQVAAFIAEAELIKRELNDIASDAREANRALNNMKQVGVLRGGAGSTNRWATGSTRVYEGGPSTNTGGSYIPTPAERSALDLAYQRQQSQLQTEIDRGKNEAIRISEMARRARRNLDLQGTAVGGAIPMEMGRDAIHEEALRENKLRNQAERLFLNETRNLVRNRHLGLPEVVPYGTAREATPLGSGIEKTIRSAGVFGEDLKRAEIAARNARAQDYSNRVKENSVNRSLLRKAISGSLGGGGGILGSGGSRGSGSGGGNRPRRPGDPIGPNFLAGILPGGRRAGVGAVLTGIGLGIATTPTLAPAAVGLGLAASSGLMALVGGAVALKLAFADLNSAAFTTQKGFNALNPVQKDFVQSIRSLDVGFVKPLEKLASSRILPGLTAGLHKAMTPAAVGAIQGGVSAFSGAIGKEAKDLGALFGSTRFAQSFGAVLKADAKYLDEMLDGVTRLFDAFIHLSQAAIPLTDWLFKGAMHLAQWADNSVLAAQASGQLAHYFDKVKMSLQALGHFVGQIGRLFSSLTHAIGFKNSIDTVNLLTSVLKTVTDFINQNKSVISGLFSTLIKVIRDLNGVTRTLLGLFSKVIGFLHSILSPLNKATGGIISLRVAVDALLFKMGLKWITTWGMAARAATVTGTALTVTAGEMVAVGVAATDLKTKLFKLAAMRIAIPVVITSVLYGPIKDLWKKAFGNSAFTGISPDGQNTPGPFPGGTAQDQLFQAARLAAKQGQGVAGLMLSHDLALWRQGKFSQNALNAVISGIHAGGVHVDFKNAQGFYDPHVSTVAPKNLGPLFQMLNPGGQNSGSQNPFGKPNPLLGTGKTGVLPSGMETMISRADAEQGMAQQISRRQAGIAWVRSHVGAIKDQTIKNTYYQEEAALRQQIASIRSAALTASGGKPSLLTQVFSASRQAAFSKAQSRFASASATGSPAFELQGVNQLLKVAGAQLQYLMGEQGTVAKGSKKWLEIMKEIKVMNDAITQGQKEQVKALKEIQKEHKAALTKGLQAKWDRLLHVGPGVTPSALALKHSERSMLLGLVKFLAPHVRHGGVVKDPYAAIPGAGHMSVDQLIKSLQHHGVHFSKRALEDFALIKKILAESEKNGVKLSPTSTAKIRELLKQISDNTKHMAAFPSTYRLPSVKQIMQGLHGGTPELRKQIAERLVALGPLHGKLPTGPTAFGLPVGGVTVNGDVHITVSGAHGDAARLAKNIKEELVKSARRNTTQAKGPNAGKNRGLA